MKEFFRDKKKYLKEPWRVRVHVAYLLVLIFALSARPETYKFYLGSGLIWLGILIRAWASGIIKKDNALATDGPYSLCRNPLYVGNFAIGYGFCFINGNPITYVLITAYFLLIYPFTIQKEERKLARLFPDEFAFYKNKVHRFLPRFTPYSTLKGWSAHQYFIDNMDFLNEGAVLIFWAYTSYLYQF